MANEDFLNQLSPEGAAGEPGQTPQLEASQVRMATRPGGGFGLREIVRLLFKHKWTLLIPFVLISSAGITVVLNTNPWYTGTATIQIKPSEFGSLIPTGGKGTPTRLSGSLLIDQVQLLRSDEMLEKLVEALALPSRMPDLFDEDLSNREQVVSIIVNILRNRILDIQPIVDSNFVRITASWPINPDLAAQIPNTLAEIYVQTIKNKIEDRAKTFSSIYGSQAESTLTKLNDLNRRIESFMKDNEIFSVEGQIQSLQSEQSRLQQELRQSERDIIEIREQIAAIEEELKVTPANIVPSTTTMDSPEYAQTRRYLDNLYMERTRMLSTWREDSRAVRRLDALIAEAEESLKEVERQGVSGSTMVRNQTYENLYAELIRLRPLLRSTEEARKKLQEDLDKVSKDLLRFGQINQEYEALLAEKQQLQTQLTFERERGMVARSSEAFVGEISDVNIADKARRPIRPTSPNYLMGVLISLAAGLGFGLGLMVLREVLNHTLETSDDVHKHLGVPVLGILPDKSFH